MAAMRAPGRLGAAASAQLSEVLLLLGRARELFGATPIRPPDSIAPDTAAVGHCVL